MLQQEKLVSLLSRVLNQNVKLRNYVQAMVHCPFCFEQKKVPKLEICLDGVDFGSYHCWICHARGTTLKSLFFKLHAPKQYIEELFSIIGNVYREKKEFQPEEIHVLPKEFKSMICKSDSFLYGNAWYYLNERGVTKNDVIRYNIGYCEWGEYAKRIIIPSYDKDGNLNFFSARDFSGESPFKYMLSPWTKDIVGFEVFINWNEPVTIVESPFNAITIRNNSIPLFGKTISDSLLERLIQTNVSVNVCLDKDAERDSIRICEEFLKLGLNNIKFVKLTKKDPNEIGFIEMNKLIKDAKKVDFSFIIKEKMRINCK